MEGCGRYVVGGFRLAGGVYGILFSLGLLGVAGVYCSGALAFAGGVILAILSLPRGPILGMNRVSKGASREARIVQHLRQIDCAKQQLALDRNLPPEYVPTEAEVVLCLGRDGKGLPSVGPERYVLNPIGKPPYAVLDSDWWIPRRGWRNGYTIRKREYRLE
jgi:hypothetical protein